MIIPFINTGFTILIKKLFGFFFVYLKYLCMKNIFCEYSSVREITLAVFSINVLLLLLEQVIFVSHFIP